jgi:uncharacterized membrane protein
MPLPLRYLLAGLLMFLPACLLGAAVVMCAKLFNSYSSPALRSQCQATELQALDRALCAENERGFDGRS